MSVLAPIRRTRVHKRCKGPGWRPRSPGSSRSIRSKNENGGEHRRNSAPPSIELGIYRWRVTTIGCYRALLSWPCDVPFEASAHCRSSSQARSSERVTPIALCSPALWASVGSRIPPLRHLPARAQRALFPGADVALDLPFSDTRRIATRAAPRQRRLRPRGNVLARRQAQELKASQCHSSDLVQGAR
jgi:hypothetical protein